MPTTSQLVPNGNSGWDQASRCLGPLSGHAYPPPRLDQILPNHPSQAVSHTLTHNDIKSVPIPPRTYLPHYTKVPRVNVPVVESILSANPATTLPGVLYSNCMK